MQDAIARSKEWKKAPQPGDHLVAGEPGDGRAYRYSAANGFGVPLSIWMRWASDMDAVRVVSEKLMQKHGVLTLMKRGNGCSWLSRSTNLPGAG